MILVIQVPGPGCFRIINRIYCDWIGSRGILVVVLPAPKYTRDSITGMAWDDYQYNAQQYTRYKWDRVGFVEAPRELGLS